MACHALKDVGFCGLIIFAAFGVAPTTTAEHRVAQLAPPPQAPSRAAFSAAFATRNVDFDLFRFVGAHILELLHVVRRR